MATLTPTKNGVLVTGIPAPATVEITLATPLYDFMGKVRVETGEAYLLLAPADFGVSTSAQLITTILAAMP